MKKIVCVLSLFIGLCSIANAQYKPTEKDLGKDCATSNGKLGTWKEVTVTEKQDNTNSRNYSNSNTSSVSGSANVSVGTKKNNVGASVTAGTSSTAAGSKTSSTTSGTERTYKDIQCVEDKNANLPQYTPVRW